MNKTEIYYYEKDKIKNLLLFRKIEEVSGNKLYLDNGIVLEIVPNMGCGGCGSGWYELVEFNECNNAITNVEFVCDDEVADPNNNDKSYKIFVFAEDKRIKVLQVDGTDGNGFYGSGYSIIVKVKE